MNKEKHNSSRRWQLGLAALIGIFLLGTAASIFLAGRKVSRVVDTDYYDHGLHYSESLRHRDQTARQWSLTPTLAQGVLRVEVRARDGKPVTGGGMVFQPRSAAGTSSVQLPETAPGIYSVAAAWPAAGEHGNLHFTKGGATLDAQVVLFE
ncbi:FixH family protein [Geomesophilobacter sediminis]|uniref:FixH family protein n=1 Tax=Geomesophilobacter sediminis TaxID=2798584 RepID=A0A8J7IPA1_9BACT|nr:FixH family protein [Geomesophilobacter sediminis]MBJ6724114.1 FixH family protein [Geomesophilobacter sediminis]